jgi:tetratricopeptide (TPR) repeat protein
MKRTFALSLILGLFVGLVQAATQASGQRMRVMAVRSESEAVELRARVQAGESFDELARRNSIDPSAGAGGYLGESVVSDLRKEFQEALYGLGPNEVSPVIAIGGEFFFLQFITERETRWQEQMDAASRALQRAQFLEAEERIREAIREAEGFGPQDLRLSASLKALATLDWAQGDYPSAASLYERVVSIQEKKLGPEHDELGTSLGNLAAIYREQADYARAVPLYERALAVREKALNAKRSESLGDLMQLAELTRQFAELYEEQENYAGAAPRYERALEILKRARGPDHRDVGTSSLNLAAFYQNRGDLERAEPLYERALTIFERDPEPPSTGVIQTLENFVELLRSMGRDLQAENVSRRIQSIRARAASHDK